MSTTNDQVDQNIEMWKMKKLIKSLEAARGYNYKISFTVGLTCLTYDITVATALP